MKTDRYMFFDVGHYIKWGKMGWNWKIGSITLGDAGGLNYMR
jgi:hypothetical protein